LKVTKIYISSPEKHKNLNLNVNLNLNFRALKFSKFSNASKLWNFLPTLQVLPSLYSVVVFPAVRIKNFKKTQKYLCTYDFPARPQKTTTLQDKKFIHFLSKK